MDLDDDTAVTPPLPADTATGSDPHPPAGSGPAPRDSKPRTRARKSTAAKGGRPTKNEATDRERHRKLEDMFTELGAAVMMFGTSPAVEADGEAIIQRADRLSTALVRLANENAAVARFIDGGVSGSAWLGVAMAFGGLGMAIAQNHGVAPGGLTLVPGGGGGGDVIDMQAAMAAMSPEDRAAAMAEAKVLADQMAAEYFGTQATDPNAAQG